MINRSIYFCILFTCASLAAGESGQIKKRKIDHQYDLKELFKKLPSAIGLYIASLAEESLNVETEYVQKMAVSGDEFQPTFWVRITTKLVSAQKSSIGEHIYRKYQHRPSLDMYSVRKKEVKQHKSITKSLLIQKFYSEQAARDKNQNAK